MNFDNENQNNSPRITGIPDDHFNMPKNSPYIADNYSNYKEENVQPFVPEYQSVGEVQDVNTSNRSDTDKSFEEREIANWQAQDLLIGEKTGKWYVFFALVVIAMLGVSIWMQSWSFSALIIVSAIGVIALRKTNHSQIISYSLSNKGVYMADKFHSYEEFRAFGVLKESGVYSIVLLPKKRFSPSTTIYFDKNDGEKITDIIGSRLPMEEVKHDMIDKIIRKINL